MSWKRLLETLVALSLLGCGGRSMSNGGGEPSAGAASSGGMDVVTGGNGTVTGGTATSMATGGSEAVSMPEPDDYPRFVIGMEGQPPFEVPWWLSTDAVTSTDWPVDGVCELGWSKQRVFDEIKGEFPDQLGAVLIDGTELAPTIQQYRDPAARLRTDPQVLGLLLTTDGHVRAVSSSHGTYGMVVAYMTLATDCRPQRVGQYNEVAEVTGCSKYAGSALWGLPALPTEAQGCKTTDGYYVFDAVTRDDTCQRLPARFSGTFHFTQWDATHADLYFLGVPLSELVRTTFSMYIADDGASGVDVGGSACGDSYTSVLLPGLNLLSVTNTSDPCDGEGDATCSWKIESSSVYGPLD